MEGSSMDNLEILSNSELRLRLLQYGFPNLPVTDTTRNVLIKKLRKHINDYTKKNRRNAENLAKFSSDEEYSDNDGRNRANKHGATGSYLLTGFKRKMTIQPYQTPINQTTTLPTSSPISSSFNSRYTMPSTSSSSSSPLYAQQNSAVNLSISSNLQHQQKSPPRHSIYVSPLILSQQNDKSSTNDNYDIFKTPGRPLSMSNNRNNLSKSPLNSSNNANNSNDSPPSSEFTRRLLNLRGETIRDTIRTTNNNRLSPMMQSHHGNSYHGSSGSGVGAGTPLSSISPDPNEIVYQQPEPRSEHLYISPKIAWRNLLRRIEDQYGVKQTLIPCGLLSVLVIFFALVIFMYITINPDLVNTLNEKNTIYTLCDDIDDGQLREDSIGFEAHTTLMMLPSRNCIEKDSLPNAFKLLKIIAPELQKRAETYKCSGGDKVSGNVDQISTSNPSFILSARDVISLAQQNSDLSSIDVRKLIKNLHNLEYLIDRNPQWKIHHLNDKGEPITFDEVIQLRYTQGNYFGILKPKLPIVCTLYNRLQKFFYFIGIIVFILIFIGILRIIYSFYATYQQSKRDKITHFIDEIINTLIRTAATNPDDPYVIVNHLRDKLIPIQHRKQLLWAWNEAVKYLEDNESRIHFDIDIRNGEDCKLMKWIDSISTEQFEQISQIKKWHSPAFDKTNKIQNPPTPCLKIRQMFDKSESNNPNLKQIIQDAILEKVGPNCKIFDIQLDKITCCVYVRCATAKDAGIIHNEINGWWFDKRLVSIKFLRLERYLNRFPKSSSGPTCLRPSNTKNLSMSQCSKEYAADLEVDDDDDDLVDERE